MFMPRSIVSMCCLARSTCFYTCLHAYMFRSTCLGFYAMLSFVLFLFLLYFDVRAMCSHAWYHFYGYTLLGSMCSCAFRHVLCLDPHPYMLTCLDSCSSMFMWFIHIAILICLDLCFHIAWNYALCHLPCACVLHAMLVCLGLDLLVMPCAIAALLFHLSHFLVFWPFGSNLI